MSQAKLFVINHHTFSKSNWLIQIEPWRASKVNEDIPGTRKSNSVTASPICERKDLLESWIHTTNEEDCKDWINAIWTCPERQIRLLQQQASVMQEHRTSFKNNTLKSTQAIIKPNISRDYTLFLQALYMQSFHTITINQKNWAKYDCEYSQLGTSTLLYSLQ